MTKKLKDIVLSLVNKIGDKLFKQLNNKDNKINILNETKTTSFSYESKINSDERYK